jgi:hypothetical protein
MWGMRGCRLLVECEPKMKYFLLSMSLSLDRNPFTLGGVQSRLGGDSLLRVMNSTIYGWEVHGRSTSSW